MHPFTPEPGAGIGGSLGQPHLGKQSRVAWDELHSRKSYDCPHNSASPRSELMMACWG